MWPVILRELRAGSRRWTTYWLRLLAAGGVMMTIGWWLTNPRFMLIRQPGREVFLLMHWVILAAIWIVVPLMTADCLSREKREGTLGLLFLTNLRSWNIVFAKGLAAGLIALTLWLSVIPIITVPVLLGGLPVNEIILSCSLALGSIGFALAAGLLASALCRQTSGAVTWAIIFSVFSHFIFRALVESGALYGGGVRRPDLVWMLYSFSGPGRWGMVPRAAPGPLTSAVFLIPLVSGLVSLVVALLAAALIRRNWQDKPKTKRQTETEKFFCSPVFMTGLFRAWMRRSLERNPIGWLEKRSWSGRITAWIWLAVMISFASVLAYSAATRDGMEGYNVLMWLLLGSMAYVAAGSFRRERETGALELILVTPLSERHIVWGRLRGLWSQFLPTFAIWIAVVLYLSSALQDWQVANILRFTVAYLIVPVVGLYFSLRSRFVLLAWLATLAVCFALPQVLGWVFYYGVLTIFSFANWDGVFRVAHFQPWFITLPIQVALAAFLLWRLRVNLARRSFSLR